MITRLEERFIYLLYKIVDFRLNNEIVDNDLKAAIDQAIETMIFYLYNNTSNNK